MNKKGDISPIYFIIAGILMFVLVSCAFGNGIMKAFSSYKNAEQSANLLSDAMIDVSNKDNGLTLKLASMNLEDGVAIYIFNGNKDVTEYVNDGAQNKRIIERPSECSENVSATCFCLCKGISLEQLEGKNVGAPAYSMDAKYKLKCDESIECSLLENVTFEDRIPLSEIVTPEELTRIEAGTNFVSVWEGGFSFWKFAEKNKQFMYDEFVRTKLADLYVVKMFENKVKICFDYNCHTNA